jgi:hypothetical protein
VERRFGEAVHLALRVPQQPLSVERAQVFCIDVVMKRPS